VSVTPYYEDAACAIYHGEALGTLVELASASVDAVITDPPYSSGGMVRGDRSLNTTVAKYVQTDTFQTRHEFSGDNRDQRAFTYWETLWLTEALRIASPGAFGMVFSDWRQLPATSDAFQAGGWVWRGLVVWDKPTHRPQPGFSSSSEFVVWGTNGPRVVEDVHVSGTIRTNTPRDRQHMTQKPIELMRKLLAVVPSGGVVLDPFMGSGTTLRAAKDLGLRAIGIEMEERYCEIAAGRLSQEVLTLETPAPVYESMRIEVG
jgi:site-specific DNA-methyltransferase (adenine-specific)